MCGCCASILVGITGCSSQNSLSNDPIFKNVSQTEKDAVQSEFKKAGYVPELPTFFPYVIKNLHATEGPGKTNPPTSMQNVSLYMGDSDHILVENIYNSSATESVLSSQGTKTELGDGTMVYYLSNGHESSISWNSKDGYFYTLVSMKPTSIQNKDRGTVADLNEQQLIKVVNSVK